MKDQGYVEPADSPYNSPIVMVKKKDGGQRLCVDYRKLNNVTQPDPTPQLSLHEAIRSLGQAKIFSLLDLKAGYWQVPLAEEARPYTAFTPLGEHLQFADAVRAPERASDVSADDGSGARRFPWKICGSVLG